MEVVVDKVFALLGFYPLQDVVARAEQQDGREGPGNCGVTEHADHALITGLGLGKGAVPDAVVESIGDRVFSALCLVLCSYLPLQHSVASLVMAA